VGIPPRPFLPIAQEGERTPPATAVLPADRPDAPDRGAVVLAATASEDLGRLLDLSARAPTGPPGGMAAKTP
jgi:hypothetical protein